MAPFKIILIFALCLSLSFSGKTSQCDKTYQIHEAFFEAFLPIERNLASSHEKTMIDEAKENSWQSIKDQPQLQIFLKLFSDMETLTNPLIGQIYAQGILNDTEQVKLASCDTIRPVRKYLKSIGMLGKKNSISDLNKDERIELLEYLINSKSDYWARLGFTANLFYRMQVYSGRLGNYLSNTNYEQKLEALEIPKLPPMRTNIRYNKKKKILQGQIDYLIIGSGPAGSVIAYRLQKAGKKVLMLEKGSFVIPGVIDTKVNYKMLESGGPRPDINGSVYLANGQGVGGGSTANLDLYIPPTKPFVQYRINSWRERGLIPQELWTKEQISDSENFVRSVLMPRKLTSEEFNLNNMKLVMAADKLNMSLKTHYLTTYAPEENIHEVGDKRSTLEQFILPAMLDEDNPLTLLPNCDVKKILIKNKRAVGVRFQMTKPWINAGVLNDPYDFNIAQGVDITVMASKIILTAGTLGSTSLLLKSKIDNPNIGKGIVVHPTFPVQAQYDHPIRDYSTTESSVYIDEFITKFADDKKGDFIIETANGDPALSSLLTPGTPQERYETMKNLEYFGGAGAMLFDSVNRRNRIELNSLGQPEIFYELSRQDKVRAVDAICTLMEILFASGATRLSFLSFEDVLETGSLSQVNYIEDPSQIELIRKNLKFIPNRNFMTSGHLNGGNKLGVSPHNSVVNGNYEVWGVKNLFVADSSVLPTSPVANPMATVLSLANIFADSQLKE